MLRFSGTFSVILTKEEEMKEQIKIKSLILQELKKNWNEY